MEYRNLELHVLSDGEQSYRVEVVESPAGRLPQPVAMPFPWAGLRSGSDPDLQEALSRLQAMDVSSTLLQKFGGQLFTALFPEPVYRLYRRSLDQLPEDAGLRIRLRIDPLELAALPWEYLFDAIESRNFVALSPRTSLVRYLALPFPEETLEIEPPLRVLVIIANPKGTSSLQVGKEKRLIQTALQGLPEGLVKLDFAEKATVGDLQAKLRHGFHILHYVGHGFLKWGTGGLVLESEEGDPDLRDADELAMFLRDTPLRLLVLNACETGETPVENPSMGLAQALVEAGVPAVVAMQYRIPDSSAVAFTREFYRSLADLLPVDACIVEGRKAIAAETGLGEMDWGIPLLFMRATSGRLFTGKESEMKGEEKKRPVSVRMGDIATDQAKIDKRKGKIFVDGEVHGDVVGGHQIKGDGNVIGNGRSTVVKPVIGDVSGSTVITAGRDVQLDQGPGDRIRTGDIKDSQGVALGSGATATVLSADALNKLLAPLLAAVVTELPPTEVEDATAKLTELAQESAKPEPELTKLTKLKRFFLEKGGQVAEVAEGIFKSEAFQEVLKVAAQVALNKLLKGP